jgi:hypothetical protein
MLTDEMIVTMLSKVMMLHKPFQIIRAHRKLFQPAFVVRCHRHPELYAFFNELSRSKGIGTVTSLSKSTEHEVTINRVAEQYELLKWLDQITMRDPVLYATWRRLVVDKYHRRPFHIRSKMSAAEEARLYLSSRDDVEARANIDIIDATIDDEIRRVQHELELMATGDGKEPVHE